MKLHAYYCITIFLQVCIVLHECTANETKAGPTKDQESSALSTQLRLQTFEAYFQRAAESLELAYFAAIAAGPEHVQLQNNLSRYIRSTFMEMASDSVHLVHHSHEYFKGIRTKLEFFYGYLDGGQIPQAFKVLDLIKTDIEEVDKGIEGLLETLRSGAEDSFDLFEEAARIKADHEDQERMFELNKKSQWVDEQALEEARSRMKDARERVTKLRELEMDTLEGKSNFWKTLTNFGTRVIFGEKLFDDEVADKLAEDYARKIQEMEEREKQERVKYYQVLKKINEQKTMGVDLKSKAAMIEALHSVMQYLTLLQAETRNIKDFWKSRNSECDRLSKSREDAKFLLELDNLSPTQSKLSVTTAEVMKKFSNSVDATQVRLKTAAEKLDRIQRELNKHIQYIPTTKKAQEILTKGGMKFPSFHDEL